MLEHDSGGEIFNQNQTHRHQKIFCRRLCEQRSCKLQILPYEEDDSRYSRYIDKAIIKTMFLELRQALELNVHSNKEEC